MTQPTLTRRHFIAAIVAAILAGPRALAALLEQHRRREALVFTIDYPYSVVTVNRGGLQRAYRKMQAKALEGFNWQAEEWDAYTKVAATPSGFRAWSQRYPA